MKHLVFISLLFSIFLSTHGQKNNMAKNPPGIPTPAELKEERLAHNCIHRSNNSFGKRIRNYPFNKAAQIKIVSFPGAEFGNGDISIGIPKENDTICYSKLLESIPLNLPQIDSLTDIFYNVGFSGTVYRETGLACYDPRNAILFFDSNGKIFEYIEICFECQKTTESSNKISIGMPCEQKFDLIKKFFRKVGIKYVELKE